jgi:3-hydroxyisobutyrate dehydrogenase/glyoxylate/succinic semialdehyde reductase
LRRFEIARGRKLRFLDAPVAGSREPAARGELTFFVGGDAANVQACRPLLQALEISQERLFEFLMGTALVAPYLASKREKIERGNYAEEFPLQWMQKDLHLAAVSAQEAAVALPLANAAKERPTGWRRAMAARKRTSRPSTRS